MLALAWLMLCAQLLLLGSATLAGDAVLAALAVLAGCAIWLALWCLRSRAGLRSSRVALALCGAASSVAGVWLVFSAGGALSYALLMAHVGFGCEVVAHGFGSRTGRSLLDVSSTCAAGLICAAGVYCLARGLAGVLGSGTNVAFGAQVAELLVVLLPAAAAVLGLATWRQHCSVLLLPAPAHDPRLDISKKGTDGLIHTAAIPGALAIVLLCCLLAAVATAFCGVVTSPYQVDMLACGDRACIIMAGVGAFVLALSKVVRLPDGKSAVALGLLSFAGMFAGMLLCTVGGAPVAPLPFSLVLASNACLIASAWAYFELIDVAGGGTIAVRLTGLATVLIVAAAVPARFIGFSLKQLVGLDGHTIMIFVLAVLAVLALVLLASVVAIASSANRVLSRAKDAMEDAVEISKEEMSHDYNYIYDAMQQVYNEALYDLGLTDREKEIAVLILEGRDAQMVAEMANITQSTVRYHQHNIYKKSGVKGRPEFVRMIDKRLAQNSR